DALLNGIPVGHGPSTRYGGAVEFMDAVYQGKERATNPDPVLIPITLQTALQLKVALEFQSWEIAKIIQTPK
ncbi:MAG: hypothetical protein EBU49_15650, partial [Proteobacteria bacterium]|nr:hypothetical protein [Pseudomonadota bacterium]